MATIEKKEVKVGKFVSSGHVETLRRNYKEKRWAENSKRIGKPDSLSVWFSLQDMESFLQQLKAHGGNGIRFYFGAYDEAYAEKPLYAGRQTIVMVGTRDKAGRAAKDMYIHTGENTSILAYNLGRLCPPICQSGDGLDDMGMVITDKGDEGLIVV